MPPKGVELGTSEVFYLEVRDKDRERAIDLSKALCDRLQREMQEIRDARAQSMIDELDKAADVAKADLRAATARLTALEKEVGSDLPELRSLLDSNSSDTSLRRSITEIENELRQYRAAEEANRQLLGLLREAEADPTRLVAAPNRLLDSQPALRRLKDGLIDAQLRTAALEGRMSPDHPEVLSAREAEEQVASRLHDELATAVRGVRVELAYAVTRVQFLEHQRDQSAARLERMAGLRTTYANALGESANRSKLMERAEQSLTLARSTQASAKAASLIALVDRAETGANPVSPSRFVIVLGGLLGGLATGIGLVLLTAPTQPSIEQCSAVAIKSSAYAGDGTGECYHNDDRALLRERSLDAARRGHGHDALRLSRVRGANRHGNGGFRTESTALKCPTMVFGDLRNAPSSVGFRAPPTLRAGHAGDPLHRVVNFLGFEHADGDRVNEIIAENELQRGVFLFRFDELAGPEDLHADDRLAVLAGRLERAGHFG